MTTTTEQMIDDFAWYVHTQRAKPPANAPTRYPVEVKSAGSKGRGVFATRNIRRGEVCCWYDGFIAAGRITGMLITGAHGYNQALCQDPEGPCIAGFTEVFKEGGCAQLCNDAETDYVDHNCLKYLKNINVSEVIDEKNQTVAFVATKRIKKGQELLYSYGQDYWSSKREREQDQAGTYQTVQEVFAHFASSVGHGCENQIEHYNATFEQNTKDNFVLRFMMADVVRRASLLQFKEVYYQGLTIQFKGGLE